MPDHGHFLLSSSFKLLSLNMMQARLLLKYIFQVLARVIQVFQGFFELKFSRVWVLRVKTPPVFELWVTRSGTSNYIMHKLVIILNILAMWKKLKKKLTLSAAPPGKIFLTTAPLFLEPLIPKPNPFPSFVNTITWIWAQSHWSCGTNEILSRQPLNSF